VDLAQASTGASQLRVIDSLKSAGKRDEKCVLRLHTILIHGIRAHDCLLWILPLNSEWREVEIVLNNLVERVITMN
jgi:hypothetical protein